jgi:hypothetical protein
MANYITWMNLNMPAGKDGVLPMQGNPVAATVTPASGVASAVAPEGAQYAVVWADVPSAVSASVLKGVNGDNLGDGKAITIPANTMIEIPNVIVGKTTITMTDA